MWFLKIVSFQWYTSYIVCRTGRIPHRENFSHTKIIRKEKLFHSHFSIFIHHFSFPQPNHLHINYTNYLSIALLFHLSPIPLHPSQLPPFHLPKSKIFLPSHPSTIHYTPPNFHLCTFQNQKISPPSPTHPPIYIPLYIASLYLARALTGACSCSL